tara:strand:+ start:3955 stop:5034 length:1080 start_codon:yes stop_codon:yes gene_type:complete
MSILGNVHPEDVSIEPFKTYKRFQFRTADTGSGVYGLRGLSGSYHNFQTGSAISQSFGVYNALSASLGREAYSLGTYYSLPLYYSINHLYYEKFSGKPKLPHSTTQPQPYLSWGPSNRSKMHRELHDSCSVISVPSKLIGERIKPKSVKITDDYTLRTVEIVDDGDGNLYDNAYSSSYALFKSSSFDNGVITAPTGSVVGNVFYDTGVIVMTNTGSHYINVGLGTGSNGFEVDYRSTHTIYQHEYTVVAPAHKFNMSRNLSATYQRSGSITIKEGAKPHYLFPPGDNPSGGRNSSGSYSSSYQATEFIEPYVTHSQWAPYVTTIGLYNDDNELLVVAKTSRPIRNEPKMDMSFVLRFDV